MSTAVLDHLAADQSKRDTVQHPDIVGTWLEVLSHLDRRYGGLTAVVPAMSSRLHQLRDLSVELAAFCVPDESTTEGRALAPQTTVWPAARAAWLKNGQLRRRFEQVVGACDGVHIHGLWEASTLMSSRAARRQRKPYVVSAHGMLEPWALAQGAIKKRIYAALNERPALQAATCLHALTLAEAEDYRRFGCTAPIAVIPNAVESPASIDAHLVEERYPEIGGRPVVLFLGRLHVKKGIELLLQAWSQLTGDFPDVLLMLAGPGEDAYVHGLKARVRELGLEPRVCFAGMLQQEVKWSALQRAHTFVLPSYSEGLSVAALEALSVGTPVVLTETCHLPEVLAAECGWQVAPNALEVERAIRESLQLTSAGRAAMQFNAKHLAVERFSWPVVCAQMAELYRCVLGGGVPKTSVYLEAKR